MPEISGVLSPVTRFTSGTINKVKLNRASNFSFERAPETTELRRRPDCSPGLANTSAEIETAVTYTISYDSPAFDETSLSEFFDQQITEGNTTPLSLPLMGCSVLTTATAPGGTLPYTGVTANEVMQVTVATTYTQEMLTQVTAAPGSPNEFQVTAGNVIFDASQVDAGKTATIVRNTDQTPTKYIGGTAPLASYGSREFYGVVLGLQGDDPWHVWWPSVLPTGTRTISTGDDEISSQYKAAIPTNLGFNSPFLAWQLPFTGTIA